MVMKSLSVPANDDFRAELPVLPDEMSNRPDAREIRAFMESYMAVEDPVIREQIRNAVAQAAAESK